MAEAINSYKQLYFMDLSKTETPEYILANTGIKKMSEAANAEIETTQYIADKMATSDIKSYNLTWSYDFQAVHGATAEVAEYLHNIGKYAVIGADTKKNMIAVDAWDTLDPIKGYPARKFLVTIVASSLEQEGGGLVQGSGELHANGDMERGFFLPDNLGRGIWTLDSTAEPMTI